MEFFFIFPLKFTNEKREQKRDPFQSCLEMEMRWGQIQEGGEKSREKFLLCKLRVEREKEKKEKKRGFLGG